VRVAGLGQTKQPHAQTVGLQANERQWHSQIRLEPAHVNAAHFKLIA